MIDDHNGNPMGKTHLFWKYFNSHEGGIGNHEAAAIIYAAEIIYTGLIDVSSQLEDIAGTLRELKPKPTDEA